jgi:hypothetical protein
VFGSQFSTLFVATEDGATWDEGGATWDGCGATWDEGGATWDEGGTACVGGGATWDPPDIWDLKFMFS